MAAMMKNVGGVVFLFGAMGFFFTVHRFTSSGLTKRARKGRGSSEDGDLEQGGSQLLPPGERSDTVHEASPPASPLRILAKGVEGIRAQCIAEVDALMVAATPEERALIASKLSAVREAGSADDVAAVDRPCLETALSAATIEPAVTAGLLEAPRWRNLLAQAELLEMISAESTRSLEVIHAREIKARTASLTDGVSLGQALETAASVSDTARHSGLADLAVDHPLYTAGHAALKQAAAYHIVRQRASEFAKPLPTADATTKGGGDPPAPGPPALMTHQGLAAFTRLSNGTDVSLAAALAAADDAGVPSELLAPPQRYLLQAQSLCQLTAVCDYYDDDTFPSVSEQTAAKLTAYTKLLTAAVQCGLPKTDPRWLRALTYRVMAERALAVVTQLELGRTDLADVSAEALASAYKLSTEPAVAVIADAGLVTEATLAHYPGVPPTDQVYLVLDRFGQALADGSPLRMANKLDVTTVLAAVNLPARLGKLDGKADLEVATAEARDMIQAGALYGPKAISLIEASAERVLERLGGVTA